MSGVLKMTWPPLQQTTSRTATNYWQSRNKLLAEHRAKLLAEPQQTTSDRCCVLFYSPGLKFSSTGVPLGDGASREAADAVKAGRCSEIADREEPRRGTATVT